MMVSQAVGAIIKTQNGTAANFQVNLPAPPYSDPVFGTTHREVGRSGHPRPEPAHPVGDHRGAQYTLTSTPTPHAEAAYTAAIEP